MKIPVQPPSSQPFQYLSTEEELLQMKSALENHSPFTNQIVNVVKMKLRNTFSEQTLVDFYIYQDSWEDPFVICVQQPNFHGLYCILFRPPKDTSPEMVTAFESFVDWSRIEVFSAVDQAFFDHHLKDMCAKYGTLRNEEGIPCDAFYLDPQLALTYEDEYSFIDDNGQLVEIRPLSIKDADQVLANYGRWRQPHSKHQVTLAIQSSPSCGVYVDGELASFALLSPVGLFNILYTEVDFRRRGFGIRVLKSLGAMAAKLGLTPVAEAVVNNEASRQVQLKAGFKFYNNTNWIAFNKEKSC